MAADDGSRRASVSSFDSGRAISPVSDTGSNPNVFDDEYAASEYADSIREAPEHQLRDNPFQDPSASSTSLSNQNPFQSSSEHALPTPTPPAPTLQPRNSTHKSLHHLRDSSHGSLRRPDGLPRLSSSSQLRRSTSAASAFSYNATTPQSPIVSEHGPSHPYGMYPQVMGVSRNGSLSVSSIRRSSSSRSLRSNSRQGPTHPYNLYPQDVSPDPIVPIAANQMYLGFPGHNQRFHRMRGPEGEEQDIVGSDGHSEQLPPYTRYPEESNSKSVAGGALPVAGNFAAMPAAAAINADDISSSHPLPLGASADNNADPNPQSSPTPQQNQDQQPQHEPSQSDTSSTANLSEKRASPKSWRDMTWKERLKTKLCRFLPLWILLLIASVVLFIITVCSAVISVALHNDGSQDYTSSANQTAASDHASQMLQPSTSSGYPYIDASPTPTPADLPPLPTGTFTVPLGKPDQVYGACLGSNQVNAWTCDIPAEQDLCIKIYEFRGQSVFDTCNNKPVILGYGTQPPMIWPQPLRLVTDLDNATLGPAWHFQAFYDKLVVIPRYLLEAPPPQRKRDLRNLWSWSSTKKQKLDARDPTYPGPVNIGEQAWFCAWEDTFIEGFIYANVSNPPLAPTASPTVSLYSATHPITWTPPPTSTSYTAGAQIEVVEVAEYERYSAYYDLERRHSLYPSGTMYPSGSYLDFSILSSTDSVPTATSSSSHAITSSTVPPATTATSCDTSATTATTDISKLVKIEERRLTGLHGAAVCTLMQMMENLTFDPVYDGSEKLIVVTLAEDDGPNGVNYKLKRWLERGTMKPKGGGAAFERRQSKYNLDDIDETCYCQWTSEQFE